MTVPSPLTLNSLVRFAGEDDSALALLIKTAKRHDLPIVITNQLPDKPSAADPLDYTMIDAALSAKFTGANSTPPPIVGLGYVGFTPRWRGAYLAWLDQPTDPAPAAFQHLYVATLELGLFEGKRKFLKYQRELIKLDVSAAWQGNEALDRAILLSFWLQQDGDALLHWLETVAVTPTVFTLALGCLSLLPKPLPSTLLSPLLVAWNLTNPALAEGVIQMRYATLLASLEVGEPLAFALSKLDESAKSPIPWRCSHRDLRIALPQPNLRPILEPLFAELVVSIELDSSLQAESALAQSKKEDGVQTEKLHSALRKKSSSGQTDSAAAAGSANSEWHTILEFGHSRSTYYNLAVELAQKQEGYLALMDENRQIIHRVRFRKGKLRPFWRLWDWVQNWPTTHVYVKGKELDRRAVWHYSPYFR
jgi:hypothetical protein